MVDEVQSLSVPQRALLWCMRMWVLELRRGIGAEPQIDEMLELLGVPEASPALSNLMHSLSQSSTRMIDVLCVCQPRLSADERTLMTVLSLAQSLDSWHARILLSGFVTSAGADDVLESAEAIATALVQAGHVLTDLEEPLLRRHLDRLPLAHATVH